LAIIAPISVGLVLGVAGVVGLIVGGLTKMNDNSVPFGKQAEQIVAEYVSEAGIPVCFNFPAGHIFDNRAFYIGKRSEIVVSGENRILRFL